MSPLTMPFFVCVCVGGGGRSSLGGDTNVPRQSVPLVFYLSCLFIPFFLLFFPRFRSLLGCDKNIPRQKLPLISYRYYLLIIFLFIFFSLVHKLCIATFCFF